MRIPRRLFLPQSGGGFVHKFWRAHNKEFLLQPNSVKELYLKCVARALEHKSVDRSVKIYAYCVMSNHSHQLVEYRSSSDELSQFMRVAHGSFGLRYNRANKRQGAVAYDRPKTPLVEPSKSHQMRVHFYIEANPLRARMVRNLKIYKYSSFRFYAWGIVDSFTKYLTVPKWYLELGATPIARQSKYRSLFESYLKEVLAYNSAFTAPRFIGCQEWVTIQDQNLRKTRTLLEKPPDD